MIVLPASRTQITNGTQNDILSTFQGALAATDDHDITNSAAIPARFRRPTGCRISEPGKIGMKLTFHART